MRSRLLLLLTVAVAAPRVLAQCPDGTPPPCNRPAPPARYSVAVLTFDLLSPDSSDAYLVDGIADDIATRLGTVTRLEVKRPRGSAAARVRETRPDYAPVLGRSLRVRYLVEGSVRRGGTRVRVSVRLVRAETGAQAWARDYDRGTADPLAVQSEIATDVAGEIVGRLLPAERAQMRTVVSVDPAAEEHYRRGNHYVTMRGAALLRGIAEYREAMRLAPRYVPALARASYAIALAAWWNALPLDSALLDGFALADRALALDSTASDAWMARGMLLSVQNPTDQRPAASAMERAVALDPRNDEAWHQLAQLYGYLDRLADAAAAVDRAMALDPTRAISLVYRAELLSLARDFGAARRTLDSAIALEPGLVYAYAARGGAALQLGDTASARRDLETAVAAGLERVSLAPQLLLLEGRADSARALVAHLVAASGRMGPLQAIDVAQACAVVGDRDCLIRVLGAVPPGHLRSYGTRFPFLDRYRGDPELGPLLRPPPP